MSWHTSTRPPLPPRPLSTYPSSEYDGQQQSMNGGSSRQSIGSPPTMNYDFQPMGYTSPTPPPQSRQLPYQQQPQQQQQQQYTPYQQQQPPPPQPDYIWNGGSLSSSNRASVVSLFPSSNSDADATSHTHLPHNRYPARILNNISNLLYPAHTLKQTTRYHSQHRLDPTVSIPTLSFRSRLQHRHYRSHDDHYPARSYLNKWRHLP
jgi:hypothetical protein